MSALLTIDLGALVSNWSLVQHRASPAECAAVVKADAYGLGIDRVVPALAKAGCRTFFVAHAGEGQQVRNALGEDVPGYRIFVLNGLSPMDADGRALTDFGLRRCCRRWNRYGTGGGARRRWKPCCPAAVQIDTGMNRLGMAAGEIPALRELISSGAWQSGFEPPRRGNVVHLAVAAQPATQVAAGRTMEKGRPVRTMPPGVYPSLVMSHFVAAEQQASEINWRQIADFRKIAAEFPAIPASLANFFRHFPAAKALSPAGAAWLCAVWRQSHAGADQSHAKRGDAGSRNHSDKLGPAWRNSRL